MHASTNPLLDFSDLPSFDTVTPADIAPALDVLLANAEKALETVTAADYPANWSQIASILDVDVEKLSRAWGAVNHLHSVADSPELRAAYTEALPRVTAFYTRMGADERLYAKYKSIPPASLNAEQARALTLAIRNFVLSGAELTGSAKARFAEIQERMADVSQKFSENVLDATDQWSLLVTAEELAGVPADILEMTKANAEKAGL
ncbi:MAG: hypothetical protein RLZZ189_1133, partial [Pseudomonadota bacterium]